MKKFEEDNMREINEARAKERLQKQKTRKEGDESDSSDDSLDGWDIRP